jgi:hypothetical protein
VTDDVPVLVPLNRTPREPDVVLSAGRLRVDYEHEEDDGRVRRGRLELEHVLAFEFRNGACFRAQDVAPSNCVRSVAGSSWLEEVVALWRQEMGTRLRDDDGRQFRHFLAYFDDSGVINVVAAACRPFDLGLG